MVFHLNYILYIIYLIQQTTILNARRQCSDVKLDHIQPSFDPLHLYKNLLVLVCIIVHCSLYTLWNQAKYVALNLKLENGYKFLQSSLDDTRFIFHIYKKRCMLLLCFASENGLQLHYTFSYPYNYMYNDFFLVSEHALFTLHFGLFYIKAKMYQPF